MQTTSFNEKESLEVIRNMIEASRQNISKNAIHYLLWGWLVIISCLIHYSLWKFTSFLHPYLVWPVLMPAGAIAAIMIARNQGKDNSSTMIDRLMNFVWAGFAGPAIIILVLGAMVSWTIVFPVFISLYGWGTLISGGILKFRPLVIGGLICFALGILSIFAGHMENLLITSLAVTSSHIVPGYLLRKSK